uniref:Uncharacterized protein n=1 Tax=Arundo donax TaxID=35708 RepID=A0A0A9GXT8_ARUDO
MNQLVPGKLMGARTSLLRF